MVGAAAVSGNSGTITPAKSAAPLTYTFSPQTKKHEHSGSVPEKLLEILDGNMDIFCPWWRLYEP
jgi:hypothetical protein